MREGSKALDLEVRTDSPFLDQTWAVPERLNLNGIGRQRETVALMTELIPDNYCLLDRVYWTTVCPSTWLDTDCPKILREWARGYRRFENDCHKFEIDLSRGPLISFATSISFVLFRVEAFSWNFTSVIFKVFVQKNDHGQNSLKTNQHKKDTQIYRTLKLKRNRAFRIRDNWHES